MKMFFSDIKEVLDVIDAETREIDPVLLRILVLAEDHRYLFHAGVDPIAVCRAICHFLGKNRLEGASTIEAQLYRTISGRREISVSRKVREAASSIVISLSRSKAKIATAYLKNAYFGFERPGIDFAARRLGYRCDEWDLSCACDLVARLKRPSRLPLSHPENASLRRRFDWLVHRANGSPSRIASLMRS